jgi:hypothetical protein
MYGHQRTGHWGKLFMWVGVHMVPVGLRLLGGLSMSSRLRLRLREFEDRYLVLELFGGSELWLY